VGSRTCQGIAREKEISMTGGAIAKTPVVRALPQSASLFQMDENSKNALFYCTLLALQFGLQPMIASKFTGQGVSKSSVVIATEIFKILVAAFSVISGSGAGDWEKLKLSWSVADSLKVAALPAVLYAIQNVCVQYGYVLLDSMTFNLLNQTKVGNLSFADFSLTFSLDSFRSYLAVLTYGPEAIVCTNLCLISPSGLRCVLSPSFFSLVSLPCSGPAQYRSKYFSVG
jgi:hypothetical protein